MNPETYHIPRNLSWIDKEQKKSIGEDALLAEFQCSLVILGDPGMGNPACPPLTSSVPYSAGLKSPVTNTS